MNVDPVDADDVVGGISAVSYWRVFRNEQIRLVLYKKAERQRLLFLNAVLWQNRGSTSNES